MKDEYYQDPLGNYDPQVNMNKIRQKSQEEEEVRIENNLSLQIDRLKKENELLKDKILQFKDYLLLIQSRPGSIESLINNYNFHFGIETKENGE